MDRREFLKKSGQAALAIGAGLSLEAILSACAGTGPMLKEEALVVYPPLKGHKVQPPENGCLVGLTRDYTIAPRVDMVLDYYQEKIGKKPAFYVLCCAIPFNLFPGNRATMLAQQGVISNILPEYNGYTLEEFAEGAADQAFKVIAREAVQFGQQYGGFFYTPMRELNGEWFPWGAQPTQAKKAWQRIWKIFEDNGANEYATWVMEFSCPEQIPQPSTHIDQPNRYYPGDEFVDWIGLSAYSHSKFYSRALSFNDISQTTFNQLHKDHPNKPILQAEFGKTQGRSQPHWLKNAYKTIKSRPGMKAALYWDYPDTNINENLFLSDESEAALKEILKDPYWITAK